MFDTPQNESSASANVLSVIDRVKLEYQNYIDLPKAAITSSPLCWWSKYEHKFPSLSVLARSILVIQASSVASERIFSTAGDIVTSQRSRLTSDNVNNLVFLNKNHTLLPKSLKDVLTDVVDL